MYCLLHTALLTKAYNSYLILYVSVLPSKQHFKISKKKKIEIKLSYMTYILGRKVLILFNLL